MQSQAIRRVLSALTALLVAAGVVAVIQVRQGPSAQSVLDDARAYVRKHPSVRFAGTMAIKVREGKSGLGTEESFTSHVAGEIASKERTHAVVTAGDEGASEAVQIGSIIYVREAETVAGLGKAKYARFDTDTSAAGVMRVESGQATDLDIGAVLAAAHSPKKTRHDGKNTTIVTDINAVKLAGQTLAKQIDWITLRMVVRKGGEIRSAVQTTRGGGATVTTTLRYADWGKTVAVAEPAASEIDPTPGIDEEAIAAWKDSPLFMPRGIPAGWELTAAYVLRENETTEGCAQVELDYESVEDPGAGAGYLYLYEFPNSCAEPFGGAGVTPFTAGNYKGFGQYSEEDGSLVQITVGATTVQADSDLTLEELAVVLKDLVRLKLSVKPAEIPGLGGARTSA